VSLRVAIFNHNRNRDAHALADGFRAFAPVIAIDSGSDFGPGEAAWFDLRLPNVYYAGLLNAAVAACDDMAAGDVLYVVCSDVRVADYGLAASRAGDAFNDPRIGVYGPSATGTSFPMIRNHGAATLRDVPFVEGFCLAARLELLRGLVPVDTTVNALGWGVDVHLSWRARVARYRCVIDDGIEVQHEFGAGYTHSAARAQMKAWLQTQSFAARRGHKLLFRSFSQTPLGLWRLRVEPWWLYSRAERL
jgi:hypothetical protein